MRLSIGTKVFLGSMVIVFLNIFYVVVVFKLADLNNIAHILKIQDRIQQSVIQIGNLHDDRRRNRVIYENLKQEAFVENFSAASTKISALLDTLSSWIDTVRILDSAVSTGQTSRTSLSAEIGATTFSIIASNREFTKNFTALVEEDTARINLTSSAPYSRNIDNADTVFSANLAKARELLEAETKNRIKDIEVRISNAKQITSIILISISVLAVLFAVVFSNAISRSLRRLKESARFIGKGNFYFDPSGYPRDEIGDLASAFFDMAVDLKKTQEELIKAKRLAAIGEVVASVNHEINNPLMIISGNAQFLEMSLMDAPLEVRDRIRTILEETERISQVTRKLRDIKNPVVEDYTSSGEQMINLDRSTQEL